MGMDEVMKEIRGDVGGWFAVPSVRTLARRWTDGIVAMVRMRGAGPDHGKRRRVMPYLSKCGLVFLTLALFVLLFLLCNIHSVELDQVLRAMFKGMAVHLVDAWEMTATHHLPHALHPPPAIVKNMMDVLLSHVCPEKTSTAS